MVGLPGVRHISADLHPSLVVTRNQAVCKERVLYHVSGIAPQANLRVNDPDIGTLVTALNERVFKCRVGDALIEPPLAPREVVQVKLGHFATLIGNFRTTPESYDQVVSKYVGRKKTIYENAMKSLLMEQVNSLDAQLRAFVKAEKVPPNKAPRCIQPRSPRHCLEVGRYIKHIEHRLYEDVADVFGDGPTVMKGYNVQRVGRICAGKWYSFNKPVALGLDAVKFDMHVCPEVLRWEHNIYLKIYNHNPNLRRLLNRQMNNVGRGFCADGKVKYAFKGKRCSGDMNTALGNCLIMCAMVYSYSRERGVHVKLMNNGDDCVVFMEQEDLSRFQTGLSEWFLALGFRMEAEAPVYDIHQIEFCQMRPIKTTNGWTMVRNIPKTMHKDSLCLLPLRNEREMREWLGAIGDCGQSLTHGVPVMSAYYRMFGRNGTKRTKFGEQLLLHAGARMLSAGIDRTEDEIIPEARFGVWEAWGILPDHQVALENRYDNTVIEFSNDRHGDYETVPESLLL